MKPLLTFLLLVIFLHASAQNIEYEYKLSELSARKSGSKDTVPIDHKKAFTVKLDPAGFASSTKFKIVYEHGGEEEDITNSIAGKKFDLEKKTHFSLRFTFWEEAKITEQQEVEKVKIKYSYDSTFKVNNRDTTVHLTGDTDVLVKDQLNIIISLNKNKRTITDTSAPFKTTISTGRTIPKDERTVVILFKGQDKEKTAIEKQNDLINQRLDELASQNESDSIGEFTLNEKDVPINNGKDPKSKIKRVEITITHGAIGRRGLRVELENGQVFTNEQAPINLPRLRHRKSDGLVTNDARDKSFIQLGDVLDYHYYGRFSYPEDGSITLTPDKPKVVLRVASSLNSLVDLSIFTDLLGLLGRKANGLIQSEVAGNFISNTANLKNTDIVFHNFMRPYVRLAKFDSKFGNLDSTNIKAGPEGRDTVNRTYLNQISYFQAGLLINIVRFGMGVNQYLYVNIGADINLADADSLYRKDVLFFNYYPEIHYSITRLNNFGLDCSARIMGQYLGGNPPFANRKGIWMFRPQATLYYYPTKDTGKKIYIRFNYFDNWDDSQYNFTQFQFGYKTNLNFKK